MSRVVVESGPAPNPTTQLVTHESLYGYLQAFVEGEVFTNINLAELLEETIPAQDDPGGAGRAPSVDGRPGRPIRVIPSYELRYDELRFSHSGIIAKCTPRELAMTVRAAFNHTLERLKLEQPNAQWRLVGALIRRDEVNRLFDSTGDVSRYPGEFNLAELVNEAEKAAMKVGRGTGEQGVVSSDKLVQASVATRADYRSLMCCVFADVGKAEIVDPIARRWHNESGPMARYAERQELRFLPLYLQQERHQAKAVLNRLVEAEEQVVQTDTTPPELEITAVSVQAMRVLRQSGQKWGEIGKAFGIPHQTARSLVLQLTDGDDPGDCEDDEDGTDDE